MNQKKRWLFQPSPSKLAARQLAQAVGIAEPAACILLQRGFDDAEKAKKFLHAAEQPLETPFTLPGMRQAAKCVQQAVEQKEKITIYGDYDVDGMTATAVLYTVLQNLGADVDYYIPLRQSEGYGINSSALQRLIAGGTKLVVTVDCGIANAVEIEAVRGALNVVVTDHHELPEKLPHAAAIVNPKLGKSEALRDLSGVGVAYKLCQALWQEMRGGEYKEQLDLVALGTIADLVPLCGENRTLVALGLERMRQTENVGIKALLQSAGLSGAKRISAGDVSFKLAPRLNATGRMDSAVWGVRLLLSQDAAEAAHIAAQLNAENNRRQQTEAFLVDLAVKESIHHENENRYVIVVGGENWHIGVIGIVASRLVEKFYKPAVVLSYKEDDTACGSCRSIEGFAIHEALDDCGDLLLKHGGHAQAAGLTLRKENVAAFCTRLNALAQKALTEEMYQRPVRVDLEIELGQVDFDFIQSIEAFAPFGVGNPRPVFAARGAVVTNARAIGRENQFVRFGVSQYGTHLNGVSWDTACEAEDLLMANTIDLTFQANIDEWNGRKNILLVLGDYRRGDSARTQLEELFRVGAEPPDPYADIGAADAFFTKAAGTTFEDRQAIVRELKNGQEIRMEREPENPFDKNAIALKTADGRRFGFLKAGIAKHLAPLLDKGRNYAASVAAVTGREHETCGVNLLVRQLNDVSPAATRRFFLGPDEVRELLIGKHSYHAAQLEAMEALERGQNTLLVMGTGRGKSAVFQSQAILRAINGHKLTLLIYPLRALVNDQYLSLRRRLTKLGLRIFKGNGTLSKEERGLLDEAVASGEIDLLLTTPEFLAAHLDALVKKRASIALVVVDESHHLADGGRRSGYRKLAAMLKALGNPTVLAATATAGDKTAKLICDTLRIEKCIIDIAVRENIRLRDERNHKNKLRYLAKITESGEKTLIFVNSRRKAMEIAAALRRIHAEQNDRIGFYHAGLSDEWRARVENWFRSGQLQTVVATSAFGEGVDLPDIRDVVLYHLPFDRTSFNQQCGRVGRDGKPCTVHLLFGDDDKKLNELILKECAPERDVIGALYLVLKRAARDKPFVDWTNAELSAQLKKERRVFLGESGVSAGLRILEELRLIERETDGRARKIYLNPPPKQKLDIASSESYTEGIAEKEAFCAFAAEIRERSAAELLALINRPIVPGTIK